MDRTRYPTDLTDEQWKLLEPLIPPAKPGGRPRTLDMRDVINGILYVVRSGCSWRMLPHDFPPWSTVYDYFRKFRGDGTWQRIYESLYKKARLKAGRDPCPSAAIIDSQSVKTASKGGIKAMMQARIYRVVSGI